MTKISPQVFSDFTGRAYAEADCVDLLIDVQKRVFGRLVEVPADRNAGRRSFRTLLRTHVELTKYPQDGDLVLMRDMYRRYPDHVGTYVMLAGDEWVLHTTERTDAVFHRIRHLTNFGIVVEGVYKWKRA